MRVHAGVWGCGVHGGVSVEGVHGYLSKLGSLLGSFLYECRTIGDLKRDPNFESYPYVSCHGPESKQGAFAAIR